MIIAIVTIVCVVATVGFIFFSTTSAEDGPTEAGAPK